MAQVFPSQKEEVPHMKWLRSVGLAAIALGIILLILGWVVISSDTLGFVFLVLAVVGVALLVADFVVRRRGHTGPV